jgi:hypothetical protein
MKQTERILKYIDDFGSITSLEAMKDLGVMRLASRINDLRQSGINIITETEKGVNRYGEPTHYARYKRGDTNVGAAGLD